MTLLYSKLLRNRKMAGNAQVAEFISRITREDLSGKFREKVKLCLLDAMGAVISGNLKEFQY